MVDQEGIEPSSRTHFDQLHTIIFGRPQFGALCHFASEMYHIQEALGVYKLFIQTYASLEVSNLQV